MTPYVSDQLLDEITDLTLACLSGEARQEEIERLNDLLLNSESARNVYANIIRDSYCLRQWTAAERLRARGEKGNFGNGLPGAMEDLTEELAASDSRSAEADWTSVAARNKSAAGGFYRGVAEFFSHELPLSLLIATVVTGTAILLAWAWKIPSFREVAQRQPPPDATVVEPEIVIVGTVTGVKDCRGGEDDLFAASVRVGMPVPLGQRYSLTAGLLEITYGSGARVILEGPCEYEVDSRRGGYLTIGRLTARVEAGGGESGSREIGESGNREDHPGDSTTPIPRSQSPVPLFAVRTPSAVVTDLGTEFGVEVDERGRTMTQVFVGSVRLASIAADGAVRAEQVLSAGQLGTASAVGEVAVSAPAVGATTFTRILPSSHEAHKAEADAYAKLVMSLDPVAYYRMERPEDEKDILTVFDSAPGGRHGKLSIVGRAGGSERLWCTGRFGGALRFRGEFFGDYVIAPRTPDCHSNQYSFCAWVFTDGLEDWSQIASEGGGCDQYRLKIALLGTTGRLIGIIRLSGQATGPRINIGQWQHVAVVADGEINRMYMNGAEVDAMPCAGVMASPPGNYLILGCNNMAKEPTDFFLTSFWDGALDEVAIFHRALSEQEVKKLFEGPAASPHTEWKTAPLQESESRNQTKRGLRVPNNE